MDYHGAKRGGPPSDDGSRQRLPDTMDYQDPERQSLGERCTRGTISGDEYRTALRALSERDRHVFAQRYSMVPQANGDTAFECKGRNRAGGICGNWIAITKERNGRRCLRVHLTGAHGTIFPEPGGRCKHCKTVHRIHMDDLARALGYADQVAMLSGERAALHAFRAAHLSAGLDDANAWEEFVEHVLVWRTGTDETPEPRESQVSLEDGSTGIACRCGTLIARRLTADGTPVFGTSLRPLRRPSRRLPRYFVGACPNKECGLVHRVHHGEIARMLGYPGILEMMDARGFGDLAAPGAEPDSALARRLDDWSAFVLRHIVVPLHTLNDRFHGP